MTIYSHSRISTFEQCPLKFKYNYIDKIKTDIENTIEAFMGSLVHDALEKLYKDLKFGKLNTLEELQSYFSDRWNKEYDEEILIVRENLTSENYRQMGESFIKNYYENYHPFTDSNTIECEKRVVLDLDEEGRFRLQGYIDRLATKDEIYEIHDYKTGGTLPEQQYLDKDRQLALYAIAVKKAYPDAKEVKLIWHYLAFAKTVTSSRTDEELDRLKSETIEKIKEIEACSEFEPKVSALCDWCQFKGICPKWEHLNKTKEMTEQELTRDAGVRLADEYAKLSGQKKELEERIDNIKASLFAFCRQNNIEVVFGKQKRLTCKTYENYKFPGKNEPLRKVMEETLKKLEKYDEVAEVDVFKLSRIMKNKEWPDEFIDILKNFASEDKVERIYMSKK